MAEIKKDNATMEFPLQVKRQYPAPLDANSLFYSLAEAEEYAQNSPLAYVGQVLTVADETGVEVYKIKADKSLEAITAALQTAIIAALKAMESGTFPDMTVGKATSAESATTATKLGAATKGSATVPIYLSTGTPTACSRTIPLITLNGSTNTAPVFYAPNGGGASGYLLVGNGMTSAPGWRSHGAYTSGVLYQNTITDYVKTFYRSSDGSEWYRVWASGWIEMGGHHTLEDSEINSVVSVSFKTPFQESGYTLQITSDRTTSTTTNTSVYELGYQEKTTTGFTKRVASKSSYETGFDWYACGY